MKNKIVFAVVSLFVVGCAMSEGQLRETLKKNPKIVFDLIEENPEQFIAVVNRAAQEVQKKAQENRALKAEQDLQENLLKPLNPKLEKERRILGSDKSNITIVEYGDLQCPACRMGSSALMAFKEKHKGEVQFYFKHMPLDFHQMALPAAKYFEAIRMQNNEKAMKFYSEVFSNQQKISEPGFLDQIASRVGVNKKQLEQDLKSKQVLNAIEEDQFEFQKLGFTGTPVVILNGVALSGARTLEDLESILARTQSK